MVYQISDSGKIRISLTHWQQTVKLQQTFQDVSAVKVQWLSFQTVNNGNKEMMILCNELDGNGFFPKPDNSNVRFLLSVPLDQSAVVSCVYSNYTEEYDEVYDVPKNLVSLTFEVLINGIPAVDVSSDNPVDMVLNLYV